MSDTTTKTTKTKMLRGEVVSDAMEKTIVVKVQRYVKHPKYGKYYTVSKRYHAHDEDNQFKVGDKVGLVSIRPMSKRKTFKAVALAA